MGVGRRREEERGERGANLGFAAGVEEPLVRVMAGGGKGEEVRV